MEHGSDLRNLRTAASEDENESHLGHGAGGSHEGGIFRGYEYFVMENGSALADSFFSILKIEKQIGLKCPREKYTCLYTENTI